MRGWWGGLEIKEWSWWGFRVRVHHRRRVFESGQQVGRAAQVRRTCGSVTVSLYDWLISVVELIEFNTVRLWPARLSICVQICARLVSARASRTSRLAGVDCSRTTDRTDAGGSRYTPDLLSVQAVEGLRTLRLRH